MKELTIDPIFRDKIPPLTEEEFKQLEQNIVSDGEVREPIVVWNNTIIDGHNRYKIVQLHPEIPFKTKSVEFDSKWDAIDWMISNQLGRRNVTDEQRTYLLGKLYEARKNCHGNHAERGSGGKYLSGQNDHLGEDTNRTRAIIAKEQKTTSAAVRHAAEYSQGLDRADDVVPGFKDDVLKGAIKSTKHDIQSIRNMDSEQARNAVEEIKAKGKISKQSMTKEEYENSFPVEDNSPKDIGMFEAEIDAAVLDIERIFKGCLVRNSVFLAEEDGKKIAKERLCRLVEKLNKIGGLIDE